MLTAAVPAAKAKKAATNSKNVPTMVLIISPSGISLIAFMNGTNANTNKSNTPTTAAKPSKEFQSNPISCVNFSTPATAPINVAKAKARVIKLAPMTSIFSSPKSRIHSINGIIAFINKSNTPTNAASPNNCPVEVSNFLVNFSSTTIEVTSAANAPPSIISDFAMSSQLALFIHSTKSVKAFVNSVNAQISNAQPTAFSKKLKPSATVCNGFLPLPKRLNSHLRAKYPTNAAPTSFNQSQKVQFETALIIFPTSSPTFSSISYKPSHCGV